MFNNTWFAALDPQLLDPQLQVPMETEALRLNAFPDLNINTPPTLPSSTTIVGTGEANNDDAGTNVFFKTFLEQHQVGGIGQSDI